MLPSVIQCPSAAKAEVRWHLPLKIYYTYSYVCLNIIFSLWTLSTMTFNDVETLKKWPIVGGIRTRSDGGVQRKAINNSTSTVGKVHKLLYDTEYVPS